MTDRPDPGDSGANVPPPAAWRPVASQASATDVGKPPRILSLMDGRGNRQQVENLLSARYQVVHPDNIELPSDGFDLAIGDGPGLVRWHDALYEAKSAQQPVFLPVMLMLPRADLRSRAGRLRSIVDEFVISPVDRSEFLERVELLLSARHQAQTRHEELVRIVNYDRVTGLPNRLLFHERVRSELERARGEGVSVHVVVIHTPFTSVLETFGHRGLDRAAVACTERFGHLLEEGMELARLDTEDWGALVVDDTLPMDRVMPLCSHLGQMERRPIRIAGESVHLRARIGIASYPEDGSDAESVINAAMMAAAQAGEGEPAFYSENRREAMLHHLRTEAALHDALAEDQFELWLQPKLSLTDNRIAGAEALIRWRLPSGELVPPGRFIPVAESSGFIRRITPWVLATAFRIAAELRDGREGRFVLAVNITPADLADTDFVNQMRALCAEHGLPPEAIEIELTESMLCETGTDTIGRLQSLREAGFRVAIDDFGTGYSSLGYLQQLPVDTLKIDKQFVDGVPGEAGSDTVIRAIIHLAHDFGLKTVAEGIENEDQLAYLRDAGVALGQGFHIARPMPTGEFAGWLEQWNS